MKKLILFLFITVNSYGQIKEVTTEVPTLVGEIAPMGSLHIRCEKLEDTYIFTYSDNKYSKIDVLKKFSFRDIDDAFSTLYDLMQKGLKKPPKEDLILEIPNGVLKLKFKRYFGIGNVKFIHVENGVEGHSIWLTKRKLRKLFGKK